MHESIIMDEQEQTRQLEELCGGPNRAFQLMRLWEATRNPTSIYPLTDAEKAELARKNFIKAAQRSNFTMAAIKAYMRLH
jgi:hypothetical protein